MFLCNENSDKYTTGSKISRIYAKVRLQESRYLYLFSISYERIVAIESFEPNHSHGTRSTPL